MVGAASQRLMRQFLGREQYVPPSFMHQQHIYLFSSAAVMLVLGCMFAVSLSKRSNERHFLDQQQMAEQIQRHVGDWAWDGDSELQAFIRAAPKLAPQGLREPATPAQRGSPGAG